MSSDPSQLPDEPVPPALAEALRSAHRAEYAPPTPADWAELDAVVLNEAHTHFARQRRRPLRLILRGGGLAAAAGLALAVWAAWPGARVHTPTPIAAFDPSKPGGITILDAFALARLLEAPRSAGSPPLSMTWDITGDGVVDALDVEALAGRAVRLSDAGGPANRREGGAT
jgi:hypothetical protein